MSRSSLVCGASLVIAASVGSCSSKSTPPDAGGGGGQAVASVGGVVTDFRGAPIAGALVTIGSATTTTAADGSFQLAGLPGSPATAVVGLTATGFLDTAYGASLTPGQQTELDAVMMPMATAQSLDAAAGGTVSGSRGASLTVGPGVFVDGSGNPVTGSVQVSLTPLTPGYPGEVGAYPGNMLGVDSTGAEVPLLTHGVLDVMVTQNGQKLQLASGQTAAVTIPAPAVGSLPSSTALWSFDLASALWQYEGTATLSGSVYSAQLPHLSFWNLDCGFQTGIVCAHGELLDCLGAPILGAQLTVTATDNSWSSGGGDNAGSVEVGAGAFCLTLPPPAGSSSAAADDEDRCAAGVSAPAWSLAVTGSGVNVNVVFPQPQVASGAATCQVLENSGSCIELGNVGCAPDGGTIVVGGDAGCLYLDGGGAATPGGDDAGSSSDPFAGSCAEALVPFFECSAGSGGCSMQAPTGGGSGPITLKYGNGVEVVIQPLGNGGAMISYKGANGQPCGTADVTAAGGTLFLDLPNGEDYEISPGPDQSEVLTCPSGQQITLSAGQEAATQGCLGSPASAASGGGCQLQGSVGTPCQTDQDCGGAEQTSCCIDPTLGSICLVSELCSEYMASGCHQSSQCLGGDTCCTFPGLGFGLCEPLCESATGCGATNPCAGGETCCVFAGQSAGTCLPEGAFCDSECATDSDCGFEEGVCCPVAQTAYSECLPPGSPCAGTYCDDLTGCPSGQTCCIYDPSSTYGDCLPASDCP